MSVHVASYGGGLNSKWMIAKWVLEKNPLHIVLFADTGREDAEKPETYADVKLFGEWLMYRGVPCQWVRVTGESLYQNSLRRGVLPAMAYGFRTCSQRWKIEPQEKFLNRWVVSKEAWARGRKSFDWWVLMPESRVAPSHSRMRSISIGIGWLSAARIEKRARLG